MSELLKKISSDIGDVKADISEIKSRMTSLEHHNKGIMEAVTGQGAQIERMHRRVVMVEKRLELTNEGDKHQ